MSSTKIATLAERKSVGAALRLRGYARDHGHRRPLRSHQNDSGKVTVAATRGVAANVGQNIPYIHTQRMGAELARCAGIAVCAGGDRQSRRLPRILLPAVNPINRTNRVSELPK